MAVDSKEEKTFEAIRRGVEREPYARNLGIRLVQVG
jgi:hypothetical protein